MLKKSKQSQLIFNGVSLHLYLIGWRYCSQLSRRFLRWNAPELKSRSLLFLLRKANPMYWYSCVQLGDTLQLLTNLTHECCLWLPLHGGSPRCQSTLFEMQACESLFPKLCMSRPNSFQTCGVTCVHTSHYNIGMYTHVHAYRQTCMQRHIYTSTQTKTHRTNINK